MNIHKMKETLTRRERKGTTLTLLGMTLLEVELPSEQKTKLNANRGVSVLVAAPGSEAYLAGVRNGDTVVEVNGHRIATLKELRGALAQHDPRDPIFMFVLTGEIWRFVNLSLIKSNY